MNAYYLINAALLEDARRCAPSVGLPSQLFQCRMNNDATKAIVQADWPQEAIDWLDANGQFLGELQPDGRASQAVYSEIAKPEWRVLE